MKKLLFILTNTLLLADGSAQVKTDDHTLVKRLIAEDLGTRTFLFSQVVESSSGKKVLPFNNKTHSHTLVLKQIKLAIELAIDNLNKADSPIKKLRRINEASHHFENILQLEIAKHPELTCTIPKNAQGKAQRSGYPDLRIEHTPSQTVFYLDPKLYEKTSRASSLRTFYYEPKTRTMKIQDDAVHLLLGVSHNGADGNWTFLDWELVDLSRFKVRLKTEFQASNKDIYRKENLIDSSSPK